MMRHRKAILLPFAVIALLFGTPVYAQDKTNEIDKLFSWSTPNAPGCVVAVSLHGNVAVNRAYGSADLERDVPMTPGAIFDAGSLTSAAAAALCPARQATSSSGTKR